MLSLRHPKLCIIGIYLMARKKRTCFSYATELIKKSQEAALSAISIFNNPNITFKSETFIVLMIISWTYLLHAYYKKNNIDYRYYTFVGKAKRKKFDTLSILYYNIITKSTSFFKVHIIYTEKQSRLIKAHSAFGTISVIEFSSAYYVGLLNGYLTFEQAYYIML